MTNVQHRKSLCRRLALWLAMLLIVMLIVCSVHGAFTGAEHAQTFFNSLPLAVYWTIFVLLLCSSLFLFPRLLRVPGLLCIHLGCVAVLAGGIWQSQAAYDFREQKLDMSKIRSGRMLIYEGAQTNEVMLPDKTTASLPFAIRLKNFRLEHYDLGTLMIQAPDGTGWRLPAEPNMQYDLGQYGKLTVLRTFRNFKILMDGDDRQAMDEPGSGDNAALEIEVEKPDGDTFRQYVFERFGGHSNLRDNLRFSYVRMVSDYISELEVVADGRVMASRNIEVNKPLHYGGYYFFQQSYDDQQGIYTVLQVTADTGLPAVFTGNALLIVGAAWHMWFRRKSARPSQSEGPNGD